MGTVYRAENIVTGKLVAVKCLHPADAANPDATERLLREARAASSLSHPNVVDMYDIGQAGDALFLVMELLEGETLRAYLDRRTTPELSEFIPLIVSALEGVMAAHELGIVHRDLKPENIFLARKARSNVTTTKVLDFGVAKLPKRAGLTLTQTGTALGTPAYMSLEQLRGERSLDARTDVYAFGVILYEGITGRRPHEAENLADLAIKLATCDPRPVREWRAHVPAGLARIVEQSIARDRDLRTPDLRTLHRELQSVLRDLPHDEAPGRAASADLTPQSVASRPATAPTNAPDTLTSRELTTSPLPRSARLRRAVVLGAFALLAASVVSWRQRGTSPSAVQKPGASPAPVANVPVSRPAVPPSRTRRVDDNAEQDNEPSLVSPRVVASPDSPSPQRELELEAAERERHSAARSGHEDATGATKSRPQRPKRVAPLTSKVVAPVARKPSSAERLGF
jgi:serine/threonine-protein kinase